MRETWKPVVTVMLLAPALTELLTGNIPAPQFFAPPTLLFLATVGYGLPILLLRELAVRRRLGVLGYTTLGLVYGIVNEGFLAKTFLRETAVPIDSFSRYGFWGGIEVPWAFTISTWHALYAFLFPILLTESLFPSMRGEPWLGKRTILWTGIPVAILTVLVFFANQDKTPPGDFPHFALLYAVSAVLVLVATLLPREPVVTPGGSVGFRKFMVGVGVFCGVLILPMLYAGAKIPPSFLLVYFAALFLFALRTLGGKQEVGATSLLTAGFGAYAAQSLLGGLLSLAKGDVIQFATEVFLLTAFALGLSRLKTFGALAAPRTIQAATKS